MKTTVNNILLTLLSLLLVTSCTLSMEEWVEAEEDKGYDEVETLENEYMSLDYKYKEDTRSLTDNIQEYIVQVEADTIIYFLDNIPSEWLPKVGGHVVANCCELFPMGLIARVLSVERGNGMYKVTVTNAEIEDAYEEFDLYIDTQIWTSNDDEEADTINLDENPSLARQVITRSGAANHKVRQVITRAPAAGDNTHEVVIRDWSMFRAMKDSERTGKGSSMTRATKLEDVYEKDVKLDSTKEVEIPVVQVTADDAFGKLIKKATKDVINTVDIQLTHITRTKMKKIVSLKEKREYTRTRTDNGYKLNVCVGHDLTKRKKKESDDAEKTRLAKVADLIKQSSAFSKINEKLPNTKNGAELDVDDKLVFILEIPFGSAPIGLIVRLKPVMEVKCGIFGVGQVVFWTSSDQVTTDIVDGKKVKDEKLTDKKKANGKRDVYPPGNEYDMAGVFGTFGGSIGGELFLGIGKRTSAKEALGVGAYVELTMNAELNISATFAGDNRLASSNDFFKLYGKAKVGGKILTAGLFGDVNLISTEWTKDFANVQYFPTVEFKNESSAIEATDSKGTYEKQDITYFFPSLGMHTTGIWYAMNEPILAVFKEDPKDLSNPDEILREPAFVNSNKWKLKTNKEYTFTHKNYNMGQSFYVVPGVQNPGGKNRELYKQYKKTVQSIRKPNIEYKITDNGDGTYDHIYQTLGDYWGDNGGVYEFAMPFTLRNGHMLNEYWEDWGIHFELGIDKQRRVGKWISLKDRITKSGKFMPKIKFYTEVNAAEHNIYVENASIYYKLKGSQTTFYINNSYDGHSLDFSYLKYKINSVDGDIQLIKQLKMEATWEDKMDDFSSFKTMSLKAQ